MCGVLAEILMLFSLCCMCCVLPRLESLESELRELSRPAASRRQEVTDKATALSTLRAKIKSASESIKFAQKKASELKGACHRERERQDNAV